MNSVYDVKGKSNSIPREIHTLKHSVTILNTVIMTYAQPFRMSICPFWAKMK